MSPEPIEETELGLGSGGTYSDPAAPRCAGCEQPIDDAPAWEAGAQWHPGCLPPALRP